MELNRITLATAPSDVSGEAEYWLSDVRAYEEMFGFEILDGEQKPVGQFLYQDRVGADAARALMFKVLADAVSVAFGLPEFESVPAG